MKKLEHLDGLNELIKSHFVRGTHTNCYFLTESFNRFIADGKLSYVVYGKNLILLLEKSGFYQLYFYLNDLSTGIDVLTDKPVVMEIVYRGEKFKPMDIIDYWLALNFKQHLTRDHMMASFENIIIPENITNDCIVNYASSADEALFAEKVLRNSLDQFTGDLLSLDEINHFAKNRNILVAWYNNEMAGVLQFEVKNNIVWLGHIAIDERFRGKGIANELVKRYLLDNRTESATKYQLWVIQDNEAAVKLYRKFGFTYGNKSTTSMLKH